jgi:WD40 repeat protein
VAFSPDGTTIVSGSSDGTVKLWDVWRPRVKKKTLVASDAEVRSVAVSPDGHEVVAGIRYGMIKVWSEGRERLAFKGHDGDVWSVTFTPDGKKLVSADGDWNGPGQVKVWDVQTGRLIATLPQAGEVLSVKCSPNGQWLATGSRDGALKVWKMPTGE